MLSLWPHFQDLFYTHGQKTSQLEQDKQLLTFKLDLNSDLNLTCLSERRDYQYHMLDRVMQISKRFKRKRISFPISVRRTVLKRTVVGE